MVNTDAYEEEKVVGLDDKSNSMNGIEDEVFEEVEEKGNAELEKPDEIYEALYDAAGLDDDAYGSNDHSGNKENDIKPADNIDTMHGSNASVDEEVDVREEAEGEGVPPVLCDPEDEVEDNNLQADLEGSVEEGEECDDAKLRRQTTTLSLLRRERKFLQSRLERRTPGITNSSTCLSMASASMSNLL